MKKILFFLGLLALLDCWIVGEALSEPPTHNTSGGYIEACGELPGLLDDDC